MPLNLFSTTSGMPHSICDGGELGLFGECLAFVLNTDPIASSGGHVATPILPPFLVTHTISFAASSGFGTNMCPKVDTTTSKDSSSNGRF